MATALAMWWLIRSHWHDINKVYKVCAIVYCVTGLLVHNQLTCTCKVDLFNEVIHASMLLIFAYFPVVIRCLNPYHFTFHAPPERTNFNPGKARACKHDTGLQEGVWARQHPAVPHHRGGRMRGRCRFHHPVRPPAAAGVGGRYCEGAHGMAAQAGARRRGKHGFFPSRECMKTPPLKLNRPSKNVVEGGSCV